MDPDCKPQIPDNTEPNSVLTRLKAAQGNQVTVNFLACNWFDQTIRVRLSGAARLSLDPEILNHFRRSFLGALSAGASPAACAGQSCPWEPPCAFDVFCREQYRENGTGLPKPFFLLADQDGDDLIAGLRVFGFATEWLPAVEMAFIDALSDRLPWKKLRIPRPALLDRQVETCEGLSLSPPSNVTALNWLTPVDAESIDLREKVGSVITRLHRRLAGLAYWHDCVLGSLEPESVDAWEKLADTEAVSITRAVPAYSGAQKKFFRADAAAGRISLSGDLTAFWPLLLLGERCGVGRGAARGRGRFSLAN